MMRFSVALSAPQQRNLRSGWMQMQQLASSLHIYEGNASNDVAFTIRINESDGVSEASLLSPLVYAKG